MSPILPPMLYIQMTFDEFEKTYSQLLAAPFEIKAPLDAANLSALCDELKDNDQLAAEYYGVSEEEFLMQKPFFASGTVTQITEYTSRVETVFKKKFVDMFPDFPEWWFSLPFTHTDGYDFSLIRQPPRRREFVKKHNRPRYSSIHIDQVGAYGLRIYVNNQYNKMYLYELVNPHTPGKTIKTESGVGIYGTGYHEIDSQGNLLEKNGLPIANDRCYNPGIQFVADKDGMFFLNEARTAHCPVDEFDNPVSPEEEKFAIAVTIKQSRGLKNAYKWIELHKILQESQRLQPERFIWASNYNKEKP